MDTWPLNALLPVQAAYLSDGPAALVRGELWDSAAANTLSHFIDIAETICLSEWRRFPIHTKLDFDFRSGIGPPLEGTAFVASLLTLNGVFSLFRQLMPDAGGDNLFMRSTAVYLRQIDDEGRRLLIKQWRSRIHRTLSRPPSSHSAIGLSVLEIIDLFLYGFGLVHADSEVKLERFAALVKAEGPNRLIAVLNFALHELATDYAGAAEVVSFDLSHWMKTNPLVHPTRVRLLDTFGRRD